MLAQLTACLEQRLTPRQDKEPDGVGRVARSRRLGDTMACLTLLSEDTICSLCTTGPHRGACKNTCLENQTEREGVI
jgi:hypothetical protein